MLEDGVMDNSYYGLPPQEQLEQQKVWLAQIDKMFKSYKDYKPNRALVDYFLRTNFDFEIYDYYAYDLTLDAMSYFQAGITQRKKEFNVDFFRCLRKLYMMCPEANKITFQKEFVKEWQYYPIDYCPYFETIIPRFFDHLKDLLDKISEDPANVENEDFEELRWYLLVSPVNVLLRLFQRVIKKPSTMIDFTLKLCKSVAVLFHDRPLKIYHNEYEVQKVEPLLCLVIRRFICCCRCEATPESGWEAIAKMAIEFCKGENPLMNAWVLLDMTLNEIHSPTRSPTKSMVILTGLAADLLAPENMTPFDFTFAASMRTQPKEKLFLAPTIIDSLLKLMTDFHQKKSLFVVENCKRTLKGLSVKMREQNVQFDEETQYHILEVLQGMPWWVEYTMSTWFDALNVEKRRIPNAVFKAIYPDLEGSAKVKKEEKDEDAYDTADETEDEEEEVEEEESTEDEKFYLLRSDEPIVDAPFEYVRCIMQLGLFDAESALELLHTKTSLQFKLDELRQIIQAILEESYLKKIGMNRLTDARLFVLEILEVFDGSTLTEHENVARSLIDVLPVPKPKEDFPKWTHNIVKSVDIQSLAKPLTAFREPWPPTDANYVHVSQSKIRTEQQRHREQLMKLAVAKISNLAKEHRETFSREGPLESWNCPQPPPPPAEPTYITESPVKCCSSSSSSSPTSSSSSSPNDSTSSSGSSSPQSTSSSSSSSSPTSTSSNTPASVLSPAKSQADGSIEYDDTLIEQMENEMRNVRVESSNERFSSLRRPESGQMFGGSSKRGGRRL